MDAEIIKDNEVFSLEKKGIQITDFKPSSLPIQTNYQSVEGSDTVIDGGVTYGQRIITTPFYIVANDLLDFPLFRDFVFSLIVTKNPFYIREKRRMSHQPYAFEALNGQKVIPDDYFSRYVGGKRYKVRLQNTFDIDQIHLHGNGEFIFETTDLPYAESIGTTQDIQRNGISSDDELWSHGMGLIDDTGASIYTHTSKSFKIYNAGNVPIHPFEQELKITISGVTGSTSYLELKNLTNGTIFRVNEAVTGSQTIVIDGPNVTSNNLAFLRHTNRQFIELEQGWNNFVVSGASSAKIEFDFRFYYK